MKTKIYFDTRSECQQCDQLKTSEFRYIEASEGEQQEFISERAYTLIFLLTGSLTISCNEFTNVPFHAKEICLLPISAQCTWVAVENSTAILLSGNNDNSYCDRLSLQRHAQTWLDAEDKFEMLKIRPRMLQFLYTVKNYLNDGITCPQMHFVKQREFSVLLRAYYSHQEIVNFFLPTIRYNRDFELFIMNNYLNMKGVQEFVDLSGLNVGTFNRKFKAQFGMSPYQWMIKQKAKHVLHELAIKDKSIADIMREFEFSDASHFNRYCKAMFGGSPSEVRKRAKKQNTGVEYV